MKIGSSSVSMGAQHSYVSMGYTQTVSMIGSKADEVELDLSDKGKSLFDQIKEAQEEQDAQAAKDGKKAQEGVQTSATILRPSYNKDGMQCVSSVFELKLRLMEQMLNALRSNRHKGQGSDSSVFDLLKGDGSNTMPTLQMPQLAGNVVFSDGTYVQQTVESSFYAEEESTAFVSQGKVMTEDGREIDFNISFEMSRSFMASSETYTRQTFQMCDPLVVNFKGDVAQLGDQKFMFDIDADGKEDEISAFNSNSGFLAIDKNNDGKINDGSELFGSRTGDGFKELAAYDKDGNGWIDENDDIFDKLKIWTKDDNGNDVVMSVKDAGLGAIYLGNADTKFSLNNAYNNNTNGVIQKSGVYLNEDGTAGTIQHVDFAV